MINVLKLKAKMVECGVTQKQLANELGIDPTSLNRKINDKDGKFLTVKEANEIAEFLKISDPKDYFFTTIIA